MLDGPNLYFPRAAVKLTLDLTVVLDLPEDDARALAARIGLSRARPGPPATAFRQRFAARAVARLVRQLAGEAGTTRLAVRARPTTELNRIVVAYPWRNQERAEALGRAVAAVLDGLPTADFDNLLAAAADDVRQARRGDHPPTIRPRIRVVAVTGTNGKTTTSRMIAHIGRCAGLHVGWSSTDGVYVDGVLVEAGDYSGPSGAARVLSHPEVELAVTETARGGILLRGVGVTHNDVSVVTNISADHLGLQGIDIARPAGRGQGGDHPHHPARWLVRGERRRPPHDGDAARVARPNLGVLPRPGLAGHPPGAQRGWPGVDPDRRLGGRRRAGGRRRPARPRRRRSDDPRRDLAVQRGERTRGGVRRPGRRVGEGGGGRRPPVVPARSRS